MSNLLGRISHWFGGLFHGQSGALECDIPNVLMTRAEACAGRHPHEAQELRMAACAYLSVACGEA